MTTVGAEQKVIIADNLALDFTGLFDSGLFDEENEAPESPLEPPLTIEKYKKTFKAKQPVQGQINSLEKEQAKQLFLQTKREREDRQKSIEAYKTYQENIIQSSQLQAEILKGIKAGADIYSSLLKATKAISLMASNNLFYTQTEDDIKAIYGKGLKEKPPLQIELKETEERLQKLREAEQREEQTDSKERIERAIKAHEATIEKIKREIE